MAYVVVLAAGALALQFALAAGLLYERRRRRRAEALSRHDLAVAARASRLTEMAALTASLAHELAQPLGAIIHNVAALNIELENGGASHTSETLDAIAEDARRARTILARITSRAQQQEVEPRPVDLNALVHDNVGFVQHEATAKRIKIQENLAPSPCTVIGDAVSLGQVVVNLLLNAMEAMVDTPEPQRTIILSTATVDRGFVLRVRDHGHGLSADVATAAFDAFVTTKTDGLGIGLAIAHRIVTAHDGRIDLKDNSDGGVTATIWLPKPPAVALVDYERRIAVRTTRIISDAPQRDCLSATGPVRA